MHEKARVQKRFIVELTPTITIEEWAVNQEQARHAAMKQVAKHLKDPDIWWEVYVKEVDEDGNIIRHWGQDFGLVELCNCSSKNSAKDHA